jgi:hypothetical protein
MVAEGDARPRHHRDVTFAIFRPLEAQARFLTRSGHADTRNLPNEVQHRGDGRLRPLQMDKAAQGALVIRQSADAWTISCFQARRTDRGPT